MDFRKSRIWLRQADFRRTVFGNAIVSFEEIAQKRTHLFKKAIFGSGNISFDMADFGDEEVSFEGAEFGDGSISMLRTKARIINFKSCQLKTYVGFCGLNGVILLIYPIR